MDASGRNSSCLTLYMTLIMIKLFMMLIM